MDQKTIPVILLAACMAWAGFSVSLFIIIVDWLFTSSKTQVPFPSRPQEMVLKRPVERLETKPPTRLRRHSSFHAPPNYPLPSRPQHSRLVSFSLDPRKSTHVTVPHSSVHRCSRSRNQSSDSSQSSHSSSLLSHGSNTLVSSPTTCGDSKCIDCGIPPLELDIHPPFSNSLSNSPTASTFLRKLPNMRSTFKRRGSSFASASTTSDHERGDFRRASMDSHAMPVVGSDSPRSILLHPFTSSGIQTAPAVFSQRKRNSSTFSNPFSANSRSRTPPTPAACDDVFSCNSSVVSSSRPFMRRFASDNAPTLSSKPRRTEPYAAPYYAQRPQSSTGPSSQPRSRSCSKTRTPHIESSRPPSHLLEELDAKLSSLQQHREQWRPSGPPPHDSDSDASLEVSRSPTPVLRSRRTAWGAVKRRVAGEKRALRIMVQ